MKRDAVARWERNNREPSWGNVLALAQALGVDCNAFTKAPADSTQAPRGRPRKAAGSDATAQTPEPAETAAPAESKPASQRKGKGK